MQAFHNDPSIKEKYLSRVRAHREADELIKGQYWQGGKGCAVGCTIHGSEHARYEKELGIPEWLARVEDTIFEGLPNKRAKLWPEQFLSAITPGIDLEQIKKPFLIFILKCSLEAINNVKFDAEKFPDVRLALYRSREAVEMMISAHEKGEDLSAAESAAWSAARSAAWSAAESAESAAESAARSAAWSAARSAAWSAARSAARSAAESAWSAAESAESAAESAESAAESAESAAESAARSAAWSAAESAAWSAARSAAWSAARSAAYERFADKLLEILAEAK